MSSDGESTDDEQVSLQILLPDGSVISVETELDRTVEDLKLVLENRTGIPANGQRLIYNGRPLSNPQTIRNCVPDTDPDKVIRLVRYASATSPPNTSIGSISSPITPRSPRGACKQNVSVSKIRFKKPKTLPLDKYPLWILAIIERIPSLGQLENLHYRISQYLYHLEIQRQIQRRIASFEAIITGIMTRKLMSALYNRHHDISLGTEVDQLSLRLSGLNLVATSGSRPESSNSNQSELAPNSDPFSGPESSNANRSESAPNSDPLPNPWAANSDGAIIVPSMITQRERIDEIMLLLFSDATFFRDCVEKGESIDRAFAAVYFSASQDQTSSLLSRLAAALDEFFEIIRRKFPVNQKDKGR